jgi:glycine/D-amino acid oxidase-like deaminating enzyme
MGELGGDAFRRTGSLRLAGDDERDELRAEYEALREDGFDAEWRDELPEPLAGRFPGAVFHPDDAVLQPARLVRRLAGLAAEAGVEIREHDRVEDLTHSRPRRSSSLQTGIRAVCWASSKG